MATGNNAIFHAELRTTIVSGRRIRGTELSERKVDCIVEGCELKSKTFRVIAKHFLKEHSINAVLGFSCNIPSCKWFCVKTLKCFTEHMKLHSVKVDENTEMILMTAKKTKHIDHSAICNTMKADTIAANLAKLEEEKVARKIVKNTEKTNKVTPTNNNDQQNPEITNEIEISDNRLDGVVELDDGVESMITKIRAEEHAENVNIQQEENVSTISTTELDISLSDSDYDPADITNYEEEEIVEKSGNNLQSYIDISTRRQAFKKEFEEIDLSSDDEDEVVEATPIEKVKTTKRKLSFTVSDNIVKKSKRS